MEPKSLLLIVGNAMALGIGAGIMGAVYRHILAYEPILNWWFQFGQRFENKWFFPPVWGCHRCISGQIALWSFVILKIIAEGSRGWIHGFGHLFGLIFAICTAIAVAEFLAKAINYKS